MKKTNHPGGNGTSNERRKTVTLRSRHGFFKSWFVLGFILLILKATIWPDISNDISGVYQIGTIWIKVVNQICLFVHPYLLKLGNWLVEAAPEISQFILSIVSYLWRGLIWYLKTTLILTSTVAVLLAIGFGAYCLNIWIENKKSKKLIQVFLDVWADEIAPELKRFWNDIRTAAQTTATAEATMNNNQ